MLLQDCAGIYVGRNSVLQNAYGIRVLGVEGGVIHHNSCNNSTQFGISIQNGLDLLSFRNKSIGSMIGFVLAADTVEPLAQYYPVSDGNMIMHNVFCDSIDQDIVVAVPDDEDHDNYFAMNDCTCR
jgi:hypothetical protein